MSAAYRDYVLGQLSGVGLIRAKSMFGGVGIYLYGLFFALIADEMLYFKVDDSNGSDYDAAGMGPFRPFGEKRSAMSYYEVPTEVLEDMEELRLWAKKAVTAAERKRKSKK